MVVFCVRGKGDEMRGIVGYLLLDCRIEEIDGFWIRE
jgi:hypothetical protein